MKVRLPPLHSGQVSIDEDPSRFKLVVAGRRFGKTRWATRSCLRVAFGNRWWDPGNTRPGRVWWIAPTYKVTNEGWDPLTRMARQIPGSRILKAEREILLPNGGRVEIRSADKPETLVGAGLDLAVLDEAGTMKESAWTESVRATLTDRRGGAILIGTPKGYNWLHDLWESVPDRRGWDRHRKPSWENPLLDRNEIEEAREDLGSVLFDQEYGAEFVDIQGGIFVPPFPSFRLVEQLVDGDLESTAILEDGTLVDLLDCRRIVLVDPAVSLKESADYTAIAACAITPTGILLVLEVYRDHLAGPDIIPTAERVMDRWDAREILVESVAFQLTLFQEARRRGLAVRRLKADRDKLARALPLAARIEQRSVQFLAGASWIDEVERELRAFPAGQHDDQVDVLAYAAAEASMRRQWAAY